MKTIAVSSGKGGVGKTNIAVNLAVAMRKSRKSVMLVDADLGISNIDVLLHLAPRHTIQDLLNGKLGLKDVLVDGPGGIKILPAGSGVQELTALDEFQRLKVLEAFDSYESDVDVLLVDTGAGISENVTFFCIAAQEIIVVTSPEPTAVTDAYALIKVLFTRYQEKEFHVLVNSARSAEEGSEVFHRLLLATEKFPSISLDYLGHLPYDNAVQKAVFAQRAFVDLYPTIPVSKKIIEIAARFLNQEDKIKGSLQFFIRNLLSAQASAQAAATGR